MNINVELTEEDISRFYKEYGLSRNWIGRLLALLFIDLVICAYLQIFFLPMIVFGAVLSVFFFVVPYYTSRAKLKRAFEHDPAILGKKTYKPFASGIEIASEEGDAFLRYEAIRTIGATRNYVFLFLPGGSYRLLPKWSFSSFSEIDRFLQLVRNGIGTVKGVKVKEPLTFKPIYLVGLICLVPLIGGIAGIIFIILGIAHYRDRIFIVIGAVGIVITVAVYGSLFYFSQNSPVVKKGFAQIAQMQINDLVKSIEFYKLQHGAYPDSLQQVEDKNSTTSIYDVSQETMSGKDLPPYRYKKTGNKYLLFSPGIDGIANTLDDIYPTLTNPDTSKLGFIRKK
jgi:hypothetical protein